MTVIARVPAQVEVVLAAEPPTYSVLWLISEQPGDLVETFSDLAVRLDPLTCRAVLCRRDAAKPPNPLAAAAGSGVIGETTLRLLGGDSSTCVVADVDAASASGFWSLFEKSPYWWQLCEGLFRTASVPDGGWLTAAIQLATVAGTDSLRRLHSARWVQKWLLYAFVAETVMAGGIAVTRVVPEMLGPGIGLTGADSMIDEVEACLGHLPRADAVDVRHSLELSGPWAR